MSWTLALSALGSLAAAAVYAGVARVLLRRPAEGEAKRATWAFALYWATTGAYLAIAALTHALAAAGATEPLWIFIAARYLGLALACAGLAGLLYYFAYLRTGSGAWLPRIALAYAAVLAFAWWHVFASRPESVAVARWSIDLAYANDLNAGLYLPLLLMLLVVPIAGAGWYLTLLRQVDDRRARYRIVVVGVGIGLQLLSVLLVRLSEGDLFQLVTRPLAGVVVAAFVLSAYAGGPERG